MDHDLGNTAIIDEHAYNPVIGEQRYTLGAAQRAKEMLVALLLREKLACRKRGIRQPLMPHGRELGQRRFKLTHEGG
jgi:hypothetical protein